MDSDRLVLYLPEINIIRYPPLYASDIISPWYPPTGFYLGDFKTNQLRLYRKKMRGEYGFK